MFNSIYLRTDWKDHIGEYHYNMNSLFANVGCILILLVFVVYFLKKGLRKNKVHDK